MQSSQPEPQPEQIALFFLALLGALALSVILAAWMREQYRRGRDVLPYQPRRPVPWSGFHVLVVVLLFIITPTLVHAVLEATGWGDRIWNSVVISSAHQEKKTAPKMSTFSSAQERFEPPGAAISQTSPPDPVSLKAEPEGGFPSLDCCETLPGPLPHPQSEQESGHQIEQLLRQKRGIGIWILVAAMALLAAPVAEEWMFRVVLQGWLEKVERSLFYWVRRFQRMRASSAGVPIGQYFSLRRLPWTAPFLGVGSILVSSLLFAGLHFRKAGPPSPPRELLNILLCQGLGNLLTLAGSGAFLKITCRAQAVDFGLSWQDMPKDILRGLAAYLLVIGPVYVVMILTKIFLILLGLDWLAPDPAPLFVLSIVLGLLYFRTHRMIPCVVLHMAFNAAGLLVFLLFL